MSIAYSFSKEHRETSRGRSDSPGPDNYEISSAMKVVKESSPEWTFARGDRSGLIDDGRPGPGQYDADIIKLKGSVNYSIGAKPVYNKSFMGDREGLPGPGSYNPSKLVNSPTYTMSGKKSERRVNQTPGPGSYDYQASLLKSSQGSKAAFGTNQKRDFRKSLQVSSTDLGPGMYEPNKDVVKYKTPVYGFGKGQKGITSRDISPGPGAYDTKFKKIGSDTKNLHFGGRPQTARMSETPGPGAYDSSHKQFGDIKGLGGVSSMRSKASRVTSPRIEQLSSPGPGAYDANKNAIKDKQPTFGFSKSSRGGFISKEEVLKPGPGAYDANKLQSNRQVKIGAKIPQVKKNEVPGPGNYDPNSNFTKDSLRNVKFSKQMNRSVLSQSKSQNLIGPGDYQIDKEFGSNAQKFTIRGRPQEKTAKEGPGPGSYDPTDSLSKDRIRSAVIKGTGKGLQFMTLDNPGPGEYYHQEDFTKNTPKVTISGKPLDSKSMMSPGPGEYNPSDKLTKYFTPSYMQSRSTRKEMVSKHIQDMPGPGSYVNSHKEFGKDSKTFTISKQAKIERVEQSPGPGQYDANHNIIKDTIRSVKMSSQAQRQDFVSKSARELPGPGEYMSPNKTIGKDSISYTMQGGRTELKKDEKPGPGQYDAIDTIYRDKSPSYRMGTSQRMDIINKNAKDLPGPGCYEQQVKKSGPQFSFVGNKETKIANEKPGPGQYDPNNTVVKDKVVSYKMSSTSRKDFVSKELIDKPGSGQYDSPSKKGGPSYTIGGGRSESRKELSPGPGQYEAAHDVVKDAIRSYKMGTTQRSNIVHKSMSELPGPGSYHNEKQFGSDAQKVTIRGRQEDRIENNSPGPGQYDPAHDVVKDTIRTYKMGTTQRSNFVNKQMSELPGPGAYHNEKEFGSDAQKVTIRGRQEDNLQNNSPGPGQYDPSHDVVKDAIRSYRMGTTQRSNLVHKSMTELPGPGSYHNEKEFGSDAKKVTIRGRQEDRLSSNSPGPGQYDPAHDIVKDTIRTYKMGTTQRSNIVNKTMSELPGPGSYHNEKEFGANAQKVTILGRQEDKVLSNLPGPGEYQPTDALTKNKVISHKIDSKSKRNNLVSKEMMEKPGPGEYDSPIRIGKDSQSAIIKGRPQDPIKEQSPGPGNYDPNTSATKDRIVTYKMSSTSRGDIVSKQAKELPGPGIYEQSSTIGKHSYAYSMGGKGKPDPENTIPGPGSYEPKESIVKDSIRTAAFSKTVRQDIIPNEAKNLPGPGVYQTSKEFGSNAKSFQMRGRPEDKLGNENPGPGNYDPNSSVYKDRVVSYKMSSTSRGSIFDDKRKDSPGPGTYESPSKLGNGPNISIRGRQESPNRQNNPGPGQYDPLDTVTKYQSPSIRIASPSRSQDDLFSQKNYHPGPGSYEQHSTIGKGKAAMIKGKPSPERINDGPGPGQYDANANVLKDRIRSAQITGSKRELLSPSAQEISKPGPGQYDLKSHKSTVAYTMGGKEATPMHNHYPGPGSYNPDDSVMRHRNPNTFFSNSPDRSFSGSPQRNHDIGPGQYDGRDYNLTGHNSLAYTIPKAEIKQDVSDTPGPGHYKIPVRFADVPRYSMPNPNEEFRYV